MRNFFKVSLLTLSTLLLLSCGSNNRNTSSLTGWNYNDPRYGGYIKGKPFMGQKVPDGMVVVEGGTFTMGQVQDDVMFDWNTTPRQMHVRSFYMDEAEVTNSEYTLYLQVTKDIFPPEEEKYKHIYAAALPDTLVWRNSLGNTDLLAENYLRHPAYSDYPVVGINWLQAVQYCKWRTNAVNMKILIDKGVLSNVLENDSIRNFFDTDVYLENPYKLFSGDSTVYKRGLPEYKTRRSNTRPQKGQFTGRQVTSSDGILTQKFRLPTEAEWEYAAKALSENREYNTIRGRKKYSWNGKYTRDRSKRNRGDQLANFKPKQGNYSGLAGWSDDGADIPIKIKSYPPNAFGLYDMSGNVSEWVSDVYRPIIDSEASDFNYYRGNIYTKKHIDSLGKVVIVGDEKGVKITYDTLANGKIVPKHLPGEINYIPITKDDLFMRRNYTASDNRSFNDGDKSSLVNYEEDEYSDSTISSRMYNSPIPKRDSITGMVNQYDDQKRYTLISDETRVHKGGSWRDREYWLDPAQRRYLPDYMSTNFIGFRCASDFVGAITFKSRTPRNNNKN